jgi:hypothetical protein
MPVKTASFVDEFGAAALPTLVVVFAIYFWRRQHDSALPRLRWRVLNLIDIWLDATAVDHLLPCHSKITTTLSGSPHFELDRPV